MGATHKFRSAAVWVGTLCASAAAATAGFVPEGAGAYAARPPHSGLSIEVRDRLELCTPTGDVTLQLIGLGRAATLDPVPAGAPALDIARAVIRHGGLVEWFDERVDGVEHGVSVPEPPRGERGDVALAWVLGGSLMPRPTPDGQAVSFVNPDGTRAIRYAELVVRDAVGTALPSRFEVRLDELRVVFDDRGAIYPISVDPVATTADFVQQSNHANAYYGFAVATAGDVNGDGYSDILVGAYNDSNGQTSEGRVSIYLGSASGLSTTASRVLESNQAGAEFGYSVASIGDFNGDGYDDIVIGAPHYDGNGAIFVYFGSASGIPATPAFTFVSPQAGSSFGISVSGAGDVNNDGYDDIIVGASSWDGSVVDEGAAFVFHGGTSIPSTWNWMVEPTNQSNSLFGSSVSRAGDVNGDGYADVVIGAPGHNLGQSAEGSITVYHGSSTGLSTTFARQVGSNLTNAELGFSVAAAGDVNGDGYADIIAGAPHVSNGQGDEGRAYVFHGSSTGIGASAARTLEMNQAGSQFAWSVATAGDVNGDGFADVIVGAHLWTNGQTDEGAAFIYLGSPAGIPSAPAWTKESNIASSEFGRAVATAGDTDGDGFSEVIVGSPLESSGQTNEGFARTYDGAGDVPSATPAHTWTPSGIDQYSAAVAVGDVNGDGYSDMAIHRSTSDGSDSSVLIFHGSSTGLPASASTEIQRPADVDPRYFGTLVSGAGDVNGDGYEDLLVASIANTPQYNSHVDIYLGSAAGLAATPAWTDLGAYSNDEIHGIGDVNGDGYSDWVDGAVNAYNVFLGGPTLPDPGSPSITILTTLFSQLPHSSAMGDVNGDGFDDFVIFDYPNFKFYYGSRDGLTSAPALAPAPAPHDVLIVGAPAGDVNGDGYADLVVGVPDVGTAAEGNHHVEVWFGSPTGFGTTPGWRYGPGPNSEYANDVSSAGDVNGDGYADIAVGGYVGAEAIVDIFLGGPAGLPAAPSIRLSSAPNSATGVPAAGDFNGDGCSDILMSPFVNPGGTLEFFGNGGDGLDYRARLSRTDRSAPIALLGKSDSSTAFRIFALTRPAAGRNDVRMDHEAVPLGTPFGGSIFKGNYFDSGAPGTNGSDISFDRLVSGLAGGPHFKMRFRFTNRNPLFPHTRWLTLPGNSLQETDVCLPSTWYRDADNDSYGDPAVSLFQCNAPTGWVTNSLDCDDTASSIQPGAHEICDGRDNDCNGLIDDGIAAPTGIQTLSAARFQTGTSSNFYWTNTGATSEHGDMVRGLLSTLRASGGNFTTSLDLCKANDALSPVFVGEVPPSGDGFWYVSRAVNCSGVATYDDLSPTQLPGRNAEILAAPNTCP